MSRFKISKLLIQIVLFVVVTNVKITAQNFNSVEVLKVISGDKSAKTLFLVSSPSIPSLAYILAEKIGGPQDGFFTKNDGDIRYVSNSKVSGIPDNLSVIKFSFLKSDKESTIHPSDFRMTINDIDGPNNEALGTRCTLDLKHIATAKHTHLKVENSDNELKILGTEEEEDGPTSRVLFQFNNVTEITLNNYADKGYLKDFDFSYNAYRIGNPIFVECSNRADLLRLNSQKQLEFIVKRDSLNFYLFNYKVFLKTNPIFFNSDEFLIRKDAEIVLMRVVEILNIYPNLIIGLKSHTDSLADDRYNFELSENRAQSTKNWLINKGISPERIVANGYGETQLINHCINGVKCSDEEHQKNRRTEFEVLNPETLIGL